MTLSALVQAGTPHIIVCGSDEAARAALVPVREYCYVAMVDGRMCSSKAKVMSAIASALDFPSYFGRNWDALDECLTDLSWLDVPRVALTFMHAASILAKRPKQRSTLIEVIKEAVSYWIESGCGERSMPFLVALWHSESRQASKLRAELGEHGISTVALSL